MSNRGEIGIGIRSVACVVLAVVATVGVAAGVAPLTHGFAVDQSRSTSSVDAVLVGGHELGYNGSDVTELTVTVNNTGSELTGDLRIIIATKNGTRLERATKSGVVFGPGTTTVTVRLDGKYGTEEFARVEVRVASSF